MDERRVAGTVFKAIGDEKVTIAQMLTGNHNERVKKAHVDALISVILGATIGFLTYYTAVHIFGRPEKNSVNLGLSTAFASTACHIWKTKHFYLRAGFSNVYFFDWKARVIAVVFMIIGLCFFLAGAE